ncbi:MAG TPA: RNA-binding cell elongation regulator Jag/EloR [Clostridia bacterium]|nr:RNA-binding cell elongation regulator Jag/EloR [Clostridia bacterium]
MKIVESSGKTIDEAILMAVAQLGVQRDNLDIEILEEPVKGLFGLIGGKDAKIRASIKQTMGDRTKGFVTDLLTYMDVEAIVETNETNEVIDVELRGRNMGLLIGHRGETLDALQYLTSLVVNKEGQDYKRIALDTENYRQKREDTLRRLAKRLGYKVSKTRRKITLEPMNPFERRIIHATLQNDGYVRTYSEGDEPYRRVVITCK